MPDTAIQAQHVEYARRVLKLSPEMEKERPVEVQKVLMNFLGLMTSEEGTPEAMNRFLQRQNRFDRQPD